jgi:hypothetical protein
VRGRFSLHILAAALLLAPFGQPPASAQAPAPAGALVRPAAAGACTVRVDVERAVGAAGEVDIDLNGLWIARQPLGGGSALTFRLIGPLQHMDRVRARVVAPNSVGDWGPAMEVAPSTDDPECTRGTQVQAPVDQREGFSATFYVGGGFDNFAPAEVRTGPHQAVTAAPAYGDPAAGGVSSMHSNAGVDFAFRIGSPRSSFQFWLAGETVHTVQSADLDCTGADGARPPACDPVAEQLRRAGKNPGDSFLYALEHATALEAFLAPRFEFLTFQEDSESPAKLYATVRFGVNMLSGDAHDAFDAYHVGVGVTSIGGPFEGSYLEAGWGRSDLFFVAEGERRWRRLKFDALLSFPIMQGFIDRARFWRKAPHVFVQLVADFDPSNKSSDSVQTFIGLDFDIRELVRW